MTEPTSSNVEDQKPLSFDSEGDGNVTDALSEFAESKVESKVESAGEAMLPTSSYRPELPDCGVYLQWPIDGHSWIHPNDLSVALKLIPSRRVFHRTRWDNTFYQLHYGTIAIRVRPTMWIRVDGVDLDVGQQVELLSRFGENDAGIYRIEDILFCSRTQQIEYFLTRRGMTLPKGFARENLRPLHERHQLRVGFFPHQPPTCRLPADLELLDVGEITDEK